MHEVVSIQVGQCGNQIGNEFWKRISAEHRISLDGTLLGHQEDRKETFFYQADDSRYIPRAVLLDLEPRVISQCAQFFNGESIYVPNEGGGAGNNWAHGHYVGSKFKADISEIIQREAEACDSLEAFNLVHSVAGGTGSGLGSLVLQELRDQFPKKIITAYSVLPTNEEGSDVVVQPYNTVLTLGHLDMFCDSVVVMDNHALGRVTMDTSRVRSVSFSFINSLVSAVMSASSSTIRFPGHMYCDSRSILCCTVPIPQHKLLVPSYTPFTCDEMARVVRATTVGEVMRRLGLPKNKLCTFEPSQTHASLSIFSVLEGVRDPSDVSRALASIYARKSMNFVSGMPPFFQTAISKKAPEFNRVSGLRLNNTSGVAALLRKICSQFDQLKRRNAFVEMYRKFDAELGLFDSARENVQKMVDGYELCEQSGFEE